MATAAGAPTAGGAPVRVLRITSAMGDLEIPSNELPAEAKEITEVLLEMQAPQQHWLAVAIEYFRIGRGDQFEEVIKEMFTKRE